MYAHGQNCCVFVDATQILLVGGLFPQFALDSNNQYTIDQAGVRRMAAVQMAINRVNNKTDGFYDQLLPRTKVHLQ